ncbi:hypothetical protein D8S78_01905 [Natrialba swarupiae]|nr:hypothetical protein [Natrialba swarupiae]
MGESGSSVVAELTLVSGFGRRATRTRVAASRGVRGNSGARTLRRHTRRSRPAPVYARSICRLVRADS